MSIRKRHLPVIYFWQSVYNVRMYWEDLLQYTGIRWFPKVGETVKTCSGDHQVVTARSIRNGTIETDRNKYYVAACVERIK